MMLFRNVSYRIEKKYLPEDLQKQLDDEVVSFISISDSLTEFFKKGAFIVWNSKLTNEMLENMQLDEDDAVKEIQKRELQIEHLSYEIDELRYQSRLEDINIDAIL